MLFTTYEAMLKHVLEAGALRDDRTQTGTRSVFGAMFRHDMAQGFPAVTTKKLFLRGVVEELGWMLRGETNVRSLQSLGVKIWDQWADENGDLGPVYGAMWRRFPAPDGGHVDQIATLLEGLKRDPWSRRHMVSAWHPALVAEQALPPCHWAFQCYVRCDERGVRYLDLMWHQRSADLFLGVAFNIASYALLLLLLAREIGAVPGHLVATFGDMHIYSNHMEQVRTQLEREPMPMCQLEIADDLRDICDLSWDKVRVLGYQSHGPISAPVAV